MLSRSIQSKPRIAVIIGTRPEAIKLAPLILLLRKEKWSECQVVVTGQHREMLEQVLATFGIKADHDLRVMRPAQTLGALSARLARRLDVLIEEEKPDIIVVQGDTTTVAIASYLGFCHRIPVAHVEAGLRTGDSRNPFPEEMNRRMASLLSTLHFCPSEQARTALLVEGVVPSSIHVVKNTVIDALFLAKSAKLPKPRTLARVDFNKPTILVTMHRRESFGEPMVEVCRAITEILASYSDAQVLLPLHKSPLVRNVVVPILSRHLRVHMVEPLDYPSFVYAMVNSRFIMTDSGGVQEEAPALGKPVLVLREKTERPEAVDAGAAMLVGTNRNAIVRIAGELLKGGALFRRMGRPRNIYGDGKASKRIAAVLRRQLLKKKK